MEGSVWGINKRTLIAGKRLGRHTTFREQDEATGNKARQ